MGIKNVVILGSTGSIGINTLKVVERFPDRFKVFALTAYSNFELLKNQIQKFKPQYVAVRPAGIDYLRSNTRSLKYKILNVETDLSEMVGFSQVHIVVIAMRGSAALGPFLTAVRLGKRVAPANKEALVMAGELIMSEAKKNKAEIIPIDSEQSAIFQCLEGSNGNVIKKVYLTASGGALLDVPKSRFDRLKVQQILSHPRWKMGKKITVDSATLMNKGFEVIEAQRLFNLNIDQIEVIVHKEAIIHSMVEFKDGSILAQLGVTDMRLPIQYALTYPERLETELKEMNFSKLGELTFRKPDTKKFPSLDLCYFVAKAGGTLPSVLNAADEEAVDAFLSHKIKFSSIHKTVEKVVLKHKNIKNPGLEDIYSADSWARQEIRRNIPQ